MDLHYFSLSSKGNAADITQQQQMSAVKKSTLRMFQLAKSFS